MNQAQFVQIPCVKCRTIVWISPAAGVGYCPSCMTPNQLPPGAAAAAQAAPPQYGAPAAQVLQAYGAPAPQSPYGAPAGSAPQPYGAPAPHSPYGAPGAPAPQGAPQAYGAPAAPAPFGAPGAPGAAPPGAAQPNPYAMQAPPGMVGMPATRMTRGGLMLKVAGAVALAVVAGGGSIALKSLRGTPGIQSLSSLGIDKAKGDPDKMIAAASAYAKKWRSDAVFWSINIAKLSADGTTDLSDSNVIVEYVSPSAVSSLSTSSRDDSIKKFNFIGDDMQFKDVWGVRKRIDPAPRGTMVPTCTAKKLAAKLVGMGALKTGATIQATIDPAFGDEWLVQTPTKPTRFDLQTCAEKK